jgi:hypothetical protein
MVLNRTDGQPAARPVPIYRELCQIESYIDFHSREAKYIKNFPAVR